MLRYMGPVAFSLLPASSCFCGVISVDGAARIASAGGHVLLLGKLGKTKQPLSSADTSLTAAAPENPPNGLVSNRFFVVDKSSVNCCRPCKHVLHSVNLQWVNKGYKQIAKGLCATIWRWQLFYSSRRNSYRPSGIPASHPASPSMVCGGA